MKTPRPFECDYDTGIIPPPSERRTFSVGIFQWIPQAGGGLKKSAMARRRFRGSTENPELTIEKAKAFCAKLNEVLE